MSKTILLFSRDPGGANTVIPLVDHLKEKKYRVRLFGKDTALIKYAERGALDYGNFSEYVQDSGQDDIRAFVRKENPDFIITGTSADDMTEKYLWKAAEDLGIPCFAILDQWVNYGVRFSPYGVSELRAYTADRRHPYLPTKIVVMDEYARSEMIKEGIPGSRILVCGQPHFEFLMEIQKPDGGRRVRHAFGIADSDIVISYASEPIAKTYGETDLTDHYWGYTERTIFKHLLIALKNVSRELNKKLWVIVRPHPKEDHGNYDDFIRQQDGGVSIVVDRSSNPWDVMAASQLVCGMSSMFLIEAVILNKPVISIQIGLKREDPFILSRRGITKSVTDERALFHELESVIAFKKIPRHHFSIIKEPIRNIIRHMENYLCQR